MNKYGFIKGNIEEEDYIFGGGNISKEILQPNGQWIDFIPEYEPQFTDSYDTYGCTIFGTINAIETIIKKRFNISPNYSERFIYNAIPVRPPGGSPQIVAETIRKIGLIEQDVLPITPTFEEFQTPFPMSQSLLNIASKWLQKYELKHDYLWKNPITIAEQHRLFIQALQYSPVAISVSAWFLTDKNTYEDAHNPNNHWCVCIGYNISEDNRFYPLVFDSYDHSIKTLDANHNIEIAKSYYISPVSEQTKQSLINQLITWFKGL